MESVRNCASKFNLNRVRSKATSHIRAAATPLQVIARTKRPRNYCILSLLCLAAHLCRRCGWPRGPATASACSCAAHRTAAQHSTAGARRLMARLKLCRQQLLLVRSMGRLALHRFDEQLFCGWVHAFAGGACAPSSHHPQTNTNAPSHHPQTNMQGSSRGTPPPRFPRYREHSWQPACCASPCPAERATLLSLASCMWMPFSFTHILSSSPLAMSSTASLNLQGGAEREEAPFRSAAIMARAAA